MNNPFILKPVKIGPLSLRPWTLLTQIAIAELGVGSWSEQRQLAAIAWMQSIEPDELEAALANDSALAAISDFTRSLPLPLVAAIGEWCTQQAQLVAEGRVDVVPRSQPDPKAPGNFEGRDGSKP